MRWKADWTLPVIVVLLLASCSAAVREAKRGFGEGLGSAVGESVGRAVGNRIAAGITGRLPAVMTPDLMEFYVGYLFTVAFHSGSYSLEQVSYEPGEWTHWRILDDEEGTADIERAFIERTAEGDEWWRVKLTTTSEGEENEMIIEALFSGDHAQLVRLRALMPGATEPSELPVREGAYGYRAPIRLTEESIEGATVGVERVTVPAGTFQARHIRYGSLDGGTLEWWLADSVPGGVVRYTSRDVDDEPVVVELTGYGKGARSELGTGAGHTP